MVPIRNIDVLLATHNGSDTLERVLDSWIRIDDPGIPWRAIIVDNGSSDRTAQIIHEYAGTLPITYLFESRRGKNVALNTGLSGAHADLVVLTDDDAIADPGWLCQLRRYADELPQADLLAGTVLPEWPSDPPTWILEQVPLEVTYSFDVRAREEGEVSPGLVLGPNMAVRGRVFHAGHRFSDHVGPSEGQYVMGSESEFCWRVAAQGFGCFNAPDSVVRHIIQPYQLEPRWILKRAYRYGRYCTLRQRFLGEQDRPVTRFLRVPRYLLGMLADNVWRWTRGWLRRDRRAQFAAAWEINLLAGQMREHRNQSSHG